MASLVSQAQASGNMHLMQPQKKLHNRSPKTAHKLNKKPTKSNITKIVDGTHTGDVVSDESDDGADDGDSSAIEEQGESDEEPDGFALSGATRVGNDAVSRLAGLSSKGLDMFEDDPTIAGAEQLSGDESDDDAYLAIEDISDSDSVGDVDDNSILRSAEQDLIAEFEQNERPGTANGVTTHLSGMSLLEDEALARRLSLQSEDSQDDFRLLDFAQDPFRGLETENGFYKELLEDAEEHFDTHLTSWRLPDSGSSREDSAPSTTLKKVRFEETTSSRTSSMSSDEDPRDVYPDLFEDQEGLALKQQLLIGGMDVDVDLVQDGESVYDFDYEDELEKAAYEGEGDSDSDSEMGDSDSDDGDTTDEETAEEQLARVQKLKQSKKGSVPAVGTLRGLPNTPAASKRSSPALSRSSSNTTTTHFTTPKSTGRPKSGTFAHDPTRASITADIKGSGVKLVCPSNPPEKEREYWERARQAMGKNGDGSPGGPVSWTRVTPRAAGIPQRPFTAKSTLGTMFDGNLDFLRSNDEHGIAKEFLQPSRKSSFQSSLTSNTLTDGNGSDASSNVNMADFVRMDDLDSDVEEPSSTIVTSPTQQDFFNDSMFESSPIAGRDSGTGLLDHLDQQRGLVSSFRNNQYHARHVSSLAAHPAKRALASEANALLQGRRAAANTPMTPARKKRLEHEVAGAGIRKTASPLVHKHRRSRGNSISGIHQTLALGFSDNIQ